jgi:sec-independent protein translocase protein TatA
MGDLLQPTHLLVIAIVLLVLFGAKRLPELGKGLGEGLRGFKEGIKGSGDSAAPLPPGARGPAVEPGRSQQNAVPEPPLNTTPVAPQ